MIKLKLNPSEHTRRYQRCARSLSLRSARSPLVWSSARTQTEPFC